MKRRQFIKMTTAGMALMASPVIPHHSAGVLNQGNRKYSDQAVSLVEETNVIDMLGGFQDDITRRHNKPTVEVWLSEPSGFTENDFLKTKASGIRTFALGDLKRDYDSMVAYLARWNGFIASNSQYLERIDTKEKLDSVKESGKLGVMLTFQDSRHFRTKEDVGFFYQLGQRVSQLTYNGANRLGYGAFEDADNGLTEYGVSIVREMNRVGMGVDLSHCGDKTTLDGIEASRKPVLITHAACRALNPGYPRAKTDEAIKKMAASGGVMGIPMLRFMVSPTEPVSIEHFLDHIDYMAKLVGVEHVGIGSDMTLYTEDAYPMEWRKKRLSNAPAKYKVHTNDRFLISIENLNHPMRTFDVTEGLIRRKYSDTDIKGILGHNFIRVLKDIFIH